MIMEESPQREGLESLDALCAALPAIADDIAHNLRGVLAGASTLDEAQRWGVALASAYAAREPRVVTAMQAEAARRVGAAVAEDAQAAAILMAMTNVYYRFRHMVEKPSYETKHARLRMSRRAHPATNKRDYELFALAVSAIHGCAACIVAHERGVREAGMSEAQVNDAIRIASTIHAAALALEIARVPPEASVSRSC